MNERGTAILIVVWVILLISAIALGVGYQLELDASLSEQFKEEAKAHQQAEIIFWWTVLKLQIDTDDVDTPKEFQFEPADWQNDLGPINGRLVIEDEGSRVNLNTAPEPIIKELFKQFSVSDAVQPLLDWRDPDTVPRESGAEEAEYAGQTPLVKIRNGMIPIPQELQRIKNGKAAWEKLHDEVTVYGPANLQTMDKEVLINLLREAGMDLDDLSSIQIMQNFDRLRKANQIQTLDDLIKVDPSINNDLIGKLKNVISTNGTYNPNFLSEQRIRAILAGWDIQVQPDRKVLDEVLEDRESFENYIHGMRADLSVQTIWSVFTLESTIWRVEFSVKTSMRTLHLNAVVRRERDAAGQRWRVEILNFSESWEVNEEAGH